MIQSVLCSMYYLFRKYFNIKSRKAYFESHASNDFAGNMFRIAEELLSERYGKFQIYISLRDFKNIPANVKLLLQKYPHAVIKVVRRSSIQNYYVLAVAKYLFTDVDFLATYEKRKGQVVIQTWHGTPLKHLGFDYTLDVSLTSNQKRAFAIADYCLFPNEYTMQHMIDSYRLENMMQGKILLEGYPRNCIFFDEDAANHLRSTMGLSNQEVFVYMPTWRGSISGGARATEQANQIQTYLAELDEKLTDNQVLFAKLHRLNRTNIDFSEFKHIRAFPEDCETYQFLSIANCLITDYSSVMFDFLCTKKKIILFAYDKEQYLQQQGTYFDIADLPFPIVDDVESLVKELNLPKNYDDTFACQKFCPYDDKNSTMRLCSEIINNQQECIEITPPNNNKNNVLLYGGTLLPSVTTLNFIHLLDHLDTDSNNYCITFLNTEFRTNSIRLQCITKPLNLISIDSFEGRFVYPTISEKISLYLYKQSKWMRRILRKKVKDFYSREFNRQFFGIEWSKIIHFGGSDEVSLALFEFSSVKEKYIVTYPETHHNSRYFEELIAEAPKNGCKLIPVMENSFLHPIYNSTYIVEELLCFKN